MKLVLKTNDGYRSLDHAKILRFGDGWYFEGKLTWLGKIGLCNIDRVRELFLIPEDIEGKSNE